MENERSISDLLADRGFAHRRGERSNQPHEIIHVGTGLRLGYFHAHQAVDGILNVTQIVEEAA